MSFTFLGPGGSCETPWIRYALLRDNVMHHLDQGGVSLRFACIYRAAAALGGTTVNVKAGQLHAELEAVAMDLLKIPADQIAISARTQAVIRFDAVLPVGPPTTLLPSEVALPWVQKDCRTLDDVFGSLVRDLLRITEGGNDNDAVQVIDS